MRYEIAYLSNTGNTAKLAKGLAAMLPREETVLTDLSREEALGTSDLCFVGFGINREVIPMEIIEALERMEGKRILLFVTCGLEPTERYRASVERRLLPFLPDDCDYKGLFLCAGGFSEDMIETITRSLRKNPDNAQARTLYEAHKRSHGHPNEEDLDALWDFVQDSLE